MHRRRKVPMVSFLRSLTVLALVVLSTTLRAQTPARSDIEAQIRALEKRFGVAQDTYDWRTLDQLYDADYVINSVIGLTGNRTQMANMAQARAARTDSKTGAATLQRVVGTVHLHGDTVLTTGTVSVSANVPLEQLNELTRTALGRETRFLNVWVKKGGEWKLVGTQLTRVEQPKPKP